MFKPVEATEEAAILAAADKPKRKSKHDYSDRSVTNWMTLPHNIASECNVPNHDNNVPSTLEGKPYDKKRSRVVVELPDSDLHVCRWCFISGEGQ